MGTVKRLAEAVERGLHETHPELRKTVVSKLALAVGAMLEGQTPSPVELANRLPLACIAEEGAANLGFAGQRVVLEQVLRTSPRHCGLFDRCTGSIEGFAYSQATAALRSARACLNGSA